MSARARARARAQEQARARARRKQGVRRRRGGERGSRSRARVRRVARGAGFARVCVRAREERTLAGLLRLAVHDDAPVVAAARDERAELRVRPRDLPDGPLVARELARLRAALDVEDLGAAVRAARREAPPVEVELRVVHHVAVARREGRDDRRRHSGRRRGQGGRAGARAEGGLPRKLSPQHAFSGARWLARRVRKKAD